MKLRTMIFWGAAAVVAAGLAYVAFRPQPVPVDLAEVVRGPMKVTINADGKTRIREVFEVSAPVSGLVLRSPVHPGDEVTAEETVVARIQPGAPEFLDARSLRQAQAAVLEAEAAMQEAESQISVARADLDYAQSQHERVQQLYDRGIASDTQLEEVTLRLAVRNAALNAAQSSYDIRSASLERARAALLGPDSNGSSSANECCVDIHAPVSGTILSVDNESAREVLTGTRLMSIGDTHDLELVVDLLSSDAVRISEGASASVERWGGPNALEAVVRRIEPAAFTKVSALGIEEQRVEVLLDIVTPAEERLALSHEFAVFVRIEEWSGEDVLQVPLSALFRVGDDWAVFVAEEGIARRVPVEIGHRNTRTAEVLSELAPGTTVVTHPSDRVAEGVEIVSREELAE